MRLRSLVLLCCPLVVIVLGVPGLAGADVIVLEDTRYIQGFGYAAFNYFAPETDIDNYTSSYDSFFESVPAAGDPWSASDNATAIDGTTSAIVSASQTSVAGPLTFGATG